MICHNSPHLTARRRNKMSVPCNYLMKNNLLKGRILDYGCGKMDDVDNLSAIGYDIVGWDPYFYPKKPTSTFDTIICIYVLNVLEPSRWAEVIEGVSVLLNDDGVAYFAVRRGNFSTGYLYNKGNECYTYQCDVKLPFKSIYKDLKRKFEIYEYKKT